MKRTIPLTAQEAALVRLSANTYARAFAEAQAAANKAVQAHTAELMLVLKAHGIDRPPAPNVRIEIDPKSGLPLLVWDEAEPAPKGKPPKPRK